MGKIILIAVYLSFLAGCGIASRVVIARDPLSANEHADLAAIYEEKGEYDLAVREAEDALKKDPNNFKALVALGNSHLQKGKYKRSEKYYKKALKIGPANGDIMNNMAMLYLLTGRLGEAEKAAKEAIEANPAHSKYYYDTLGRIYEKAGKTEEAKKAFDKAGELFKDGRN